MAIFDIFKKKKEGDAAEKENAAEKAAAVKIEKKNVKKKKESPAVKIRTSTVAWRVFRHPHVTEKATDLVKKNQYIFRVFSNTNKTEIKKAVKDLYGVDAVDVRIINVPKKRRRVRGIFGWRKGYKKAIIKLKKDQKIEVLPR